MIGRYGLGPVFEAECLTASRRVQFYSARVLLVLGLLGGLGVVWAARLIGTTGMTLDELASVGRSFYSAMMGVELAMVLMVAPAATAGAICQDRARGGLALLMTTDLSDSEIVFGRLASRLISTLGVIACSLPVLGLATLLGGVDPVAVAGATLVVVGVAFLSVGMALTFSLWAGKPQEALSATYAVWAAWILTYLVCDEVFHHVPEFVQRSNPFWLAFSNWGPTRDLLLHQSIFFAACLVATAALGALSTWKLRAVTLDRRIRPARARVRAWKVRLPRWLRTIGQAAPDLDDDPILWREWHRKRPSTFTRAIWSAYILICVPLTLISPFQRNFGSGVNAFSVAIGLLLASVGAATALAEERVQGGLDVVLATPIDSRSIARGKWWGAFRIVPRLAILPTLLVLATGLLHGAGWTTPILTVMVLGLVLAYGSIVTSLGLLFAIAQPRQGRAVGLMVAVYLIVTVAYPAVFLPIFRLGPTDLLPLCPSPFFGLMIPTMVFEDGLGMYRWSGSPWISWSLAFAGVVLTSVILRWFVLRMFDRGLGRIRDPLAGRDRSQDEPNLAEASDPSSPPDR